MVGHGGSSAGSYLADPTSPIPSHWASIVVTSTLRVNLTDVCILAQLFDSYPSPHVVICARSLVGPSNTIPHHLLATSHLSCCSFYCHSPDHSHTFKHHCLLTSKVSSLIETAHTFPCLTTVSFRSFLHWVLITYICFTSHHSLFTTGCAESFCNNLFPWCICFNLLVCCTTLS